MCSTINCFSSGINILAGTSSVPLISERKGTDPHCTHFASQRGSCDVIASLACVQLTGWPVAWNWRRAVLSVDAGLLVIIYEGHSTNKLQKMASLSIFKIWNVNFVQNLIRDIHSHFYADDIITVTSLAVRIHSMSALFCLPVFIHN